MSNMNLPIEVFDVFERKFGREDALVLGKALEATFSRLEERGAEIAVQRKIEVKDELKRELKDELATKEDIANLRTDIAKMEARLDKKFTVLFVVAIFSTLFVNKDALTWFAHIIGLIR